MSKRIRFSAEFDSDIDEIWFFIASENPDAADRFVESFKPIYEILTRNPNAGRLRPELKEGLRGFPHKSYLIFYFQTDDGVFIYRIIHAARDIDEIFADH